ncbi:MAG: glycosyltransferase [Candidatus Onthovivens sp.]|nr:glycosyltransferase [Candidatus Onthovivens sp.]
MRKIYWFLQQIEFLGGTETATISIANLLCNDFDITLVVTGKEVKNVPYNIDKNIKILFLNNECYSRIDEKILGFCKEKFYYKAFSLLIKNINFVLFSKFKYRKLIKKITAENDILIGSSLDNYMIIPRGRTFVKHYHFNGKFGNSFNEKFMKLFYRKPDYYVFLNESILEAINGKNKYKKSRSFFIENPIKIKRNFIRKEAENKFIFLGRFADQKNPLFLIKSMSLLRSKNVKFTLDLYGEGKLENQIKSLISELSLDDCVFVHKPEKDIQKILMDKNLLLLTSLYEGMPLVINEAAALGVPTFTTNFGESTIDCVTKENGIIVNAKSPEEYASHLYLFLNDKNKLENLAISAFNFSAKFDDSTIRQKRIDFLSHI